MRLETMFKLSSLVRRLLAGIRQLPGLGFCQSLQKMYWYILPVRSVFFFENAYGQPMVWDQSIQVLGP